MLKAEIRLRTALQERNITQKDLAEMTDIRPAAISQLARGYIGSLNLDHAPRIANALGITDIRELITLTPED